MMVTVGFFLLFLLLVPNTNIDMSVSIAALYLIIFYSLK